MSKIKSVSLSTEQIETLVRTGRLTVYTRVDPQPVGRGKRKQPIECPWGKVSDIVYVCDATKAMLVDPNGARIVAKMLIESAQVADIEMKRVNTDDGMAWAWKVSLVHYARLGRLNP